MLAKKKKEDSEVVKTVKKVKQLPVPAMENKARVLKALDNVIKGKAYPNLVDFLKGIRNFIDERVD